MAEQVGVIVKAGDEMKADQSGTVFKMGVDKFTYSLFDTKLQAIAKEHLGKRVKVTYNQSADGKYRNVESIVIAGDGEESTPQKATGARQWGGKSPEEIASIEAQSAEKIKAEAARIVADLWIADKLTEDSPRVEAMQAWVWHRLRGELKEGAKPLDKPIDKGVKGLEREAAPLSEEPPKPALERFKDECLRNGWDVKTKKGGDCIASWLTEHFHMKWNDLAEGAQERAIEQMRQMADEKEE